MRKGKVIIEIQWNFDFNIVFVMAYNVPGLGAVPAIRDYKDNDGAQQNKLFP